MAKYLSIKMYCRFLAVCLIVLATVYLKDHIPTFSNGQLTRSNAMELINDHDKFITVMQLPFINTNEMFEAGVREDLWKTDAFFKVELTNEGKRYFTEIDRTSLGTTLMLREVLFRRAVEITGITNGVSEGIREIEFIWEYRELPEIIARYSGQRKGNYWGAALMRLYDDGWRVEKVELKGEVLLQ